ncbi:replication factor C small subunit [Candidatus Micrarchaeota archaeon]|nr:replication factor C small subunit [Candidatus Micrarchaeota archaeon]
MGLPWTEKYRPKRLKDVVGHRPIVKRLEAYAEMKNMPNMLFAGMPGIGKTVCSVAMANEIFGDTFSQNFLELNASDERGIDIIRGKIKDFAATLPYGGADFKIIFLDEADALTRDAQNALRRTMENYARTCRFVLSCNYSSKIIEPIQSRCALFRFKPLPEDEITKRLEHIAKEEKLHVDAGAYVALVYASEGDMRKAINYLQTSSALKEKITEDSVYKVAARAKPREIKQLLELGLKGEFAEARKMLDALLFEYGMSGEEVILQVYKEVLTSDALDDLKKIELIDRIGEYNFRITEGANERIQLESLLAHLVLLGKKK